MPAICMAILTATVAWVRLYVQNDYVLFQFQEQKLFIPGWEFFSQTIHQPGGPFTWLGLYLLQYFYHPATGTAILILIWTAGYLASVRAFRLEGPLSTLAVFPVAGLIGTLLCTGYWIYVLKVPEYAITPSLLYLTAASLALAFRNVRWSLVWQSIVCIAFTIYGLFWMKRAFVPQGLNPVFYFALFSVAALPLLSLACRLLSGTFKRFKRLTLLLNAVFVIASVGFVWFYSGVNTFKSDAYRTEMLMTRAIEKGQWQEALDYADSIRTNTAGSKVTRQIWLLRQVALMNLGRLGDELFAYNNKTVLPKATAGVKLHMVEIGGPLLYFMNGYTHFAYRWCIENTVEYGPSAARLRLLAMCAIVNGEDDLARKYLNILSQTRFHRQWAKEQYALLDDRSLIVASEPYRLSSLFQSDMVNKTDGDNGLCEIFMMKSLSTLNNVTIPQLSELCLSYAMIRLNPAFFWMQFLNYLKLHPGVRIPLHYQQAAVLFSTVNPNLVPAEIDFEKLGIDVSMASEFERLQADENAGTEYGGSYFWFYLFCKENATY